MAERRNKTKIPAYQAVEFAEQERLTKRAGRRLEERLNGIEERGTNFFNKVMGGEIGKIKFKNKKQENFYNLISKKDFIICKGTAGTGKTYLAVHAALKLLADPLNEYDRIVLIKSVTAVAGEEVGFLKGSVDEKLDAYMSSYFNVFTKFMSEHQYKSLQENKVIQELGLFQIRGWSLEKTIVIIDEGQNLSHHAMKTAMTRIEESSKMIILGDTTQIDMKRKSDSSLEFIYDKFEKYDEEFGVFEFLEEDVVRNKIIRIIERVFQERDLELENKRQKK